MLLPQLNVHPAYAVPILRQHSRLAQPNHTPCVTGNMEALRKLLADTGELELQGVLLDILMQAPADALAALSLDSPALSCLNDWLCALLEEPRAFHIIEQLLQVSHLPIDTASPSCCHG